MTGSSANGSRMTSERSKFPFARNSLRKVVLAIVAHDVCAPMQERHVRTRAKLQHERVQGSAHSSTCCESVWPLHESRQRYLTMLRIKDPRGHQSLLSALQPERSRGAGQTESGLMNNHARCSEQVHNLAKADLGTAPLLHLQLVLHCARQWRTPKYNISQATQLHLLNSFGHPSSA